MTRRAVCVFCGSSDGVRPSYRASAAALGEALAARATTLVYGGASVGLMGAVADAALRAGGQVVGVLPLSMQERELAHPGLSQLHIVGSMHERKALMVELAHAFVALPGGMGTLDELFECLTWRQLGIHRKPIGILDVDAYYRPLLGWLDAAVAAGFVGDAHRRGIEVADDAGALLDRLEGATPGDGSDRPEVPDGFPGPFAGGGH